MIVIAHEAVEVFPSPETAFAIELMIDPVRRSGFPRLDDLVEKTAVVLLEKHMDVVRHYAPCKQLVSVLIVVEQTFLHDRRARGVTKQAAAVAGI